MHPASFFALKLECHNQPCFAQLCRLKASSVLFFPLLAEWLIKGYVYQDVRGYNVKNDVDKANVKNREKEIGPLLKERLHLEACSVRQGSGTSNCGNTSRRAFAQPEIFADIVNMPVDLIKESVATVLKFHAIFHLKHSVSKVLQTYNESIHEVGFFGLFFSLPSIHYLSISKHEIPQLWFHFIV